MGFLSPGAKKTVGNNVNLVPRAFPLKNGWGGKSPGDEVVITWPVIRRSFTLFCLRECPLSGVLRLYNETLLLQRIFSSPLTLRYIQVPLYINKSVTKTGATEMEAALILQFRIYIFLPIFPNSRPFLTFFFGVSEILAKKVCCLL